MPDDADAIQLLARLHSGDPRAAEEMLPLVYDELRRIAQRMLGGQGGNTLQATALIHEAYLRLSGGDARFEDSRHFVRVAARAMRFALVDHARAKSADKRGGARRRLTLDDNLFEVVAETETVLAINDALTSLAANDERLARIVEFKFFGGLTNAQTAAALDTSLRSVERGWRLARAWLVTAMEDA